MISWMTTGLSDPRGMAARMRSRSAGSMRRLSCAQARRVVIGTATLPSRRQQRRSLRPGAGEWGTWVTRRVASAEALPRVRPGKGETSHAAGAPPVIFALVSIALDWRRAAGEHARAEVVVALLPALLIGRDE